MCDASNQGTCHVDIPVIIRKLGQTDLITKTFITANICIVLGITGIRFTRTP